MHIYIIHLTIKDGWRKGILLKFSTNKTVKAGLWPRLEPCVKPRYLNPVELFPSCPAAGRGVQGYLAHKKQTPPRATVGPGA